MQMVDMTNKSVNKNIALNIVRLRKQKGFHKAELFAEKAKIPYPTLRDIEAGYSGGHFTTRQKIADALGITEAELFMDPPELNQESLHPDDHKKQKVIDLSNEELKALIKEEISGAITKNLTHFEPMSKKSTDSASTHNEKLINFIKTLSESESKYFMNKFKEYVHEYRNMVESGELDISNKIKKKQKKSVSI